MNKIYATLTALIAALLGRRIGLRCLRAAGL